MLHSPVFWCKNLVFFAEAMLWEMQVRKNKKVLTELTYFLVSLAIKWEKTWIYKKIGQFFSLSYHFTPSEWNHIFHFSYLSQKQKTALKSRFFISCYSCRTVWKGLFFLPNLYFSHPGMRWKLFRRSFLWKNSLVKCFQEYFARIRARFTFCFFLWSVYRW